ncbi:unknown similar to AMEV008 [Mythimna separata entomopoxvirus 'L']|uniref:Uncharacterized protein n=1 Tax=Mythimna separata entomopoxvirus 'L' TaxID=1293572 RepID=A0A916NY87_9POXV|nr:unknown similar to AMEV008 [Mythimna separata entomopoxvirus 'L']CCU56243.1 unknown similar to AMEV008 [Mythimna separata entomopoxvirus 'L']
MQNLHTNFIDMFNYLSKSIILSRDKNLNKICDRIIHKLLKYIFEYMHKIKNKYIFRVELTIYKYNDDYTIYMPSNFMHILIKNKFVITDKINPYKFKIKNLDNEQIGYKAIIAYIKDFKLNYKC